MSGDVNRETQLNPLQPDAPIVAIVCTPTFRVTLAVGHSTRSAGAFLKAVDEIRDRAAAERVVHMAETAMSGGRFGVVDSGKPEPRA
jgi:hypothetical protein